VQKQNQLLSFMHYNKNYFEDLFVQITCHDQLSIILLYAIFL